MFKPDVGGQVKEDLLILAESAYRTYHRSRGTIPEYEFSSLPADQKSAWEDVAFAVLFQTAQLAFDHSKPQMEGSIQ
jgi:hypothetical protein